MRARSLLLLVCAAAPACIASNVVESGARMVAVDRASLAWTPLAGPLPEGLWSSVEITGDAALSLRRIYYWFAADGSYTAAALGDGEAGLVFQTLSGTWQMAPAGLVLDGAEPVPVEQAQDHLRITAPNGALVLRREASQ